MTISYTLYLASNAKPEEVAKALESAAGPLPADALAKSPSSGAIWIQDGSVSIMVWEIDWRPGSIEAYGVAARLGVEFQLAAEDSESAKTPMIRDLVAVLAALPGDAVFNDVAGGAVLRRLSGTLELNLTSSFWTPKLLALVTLPHEERRF